MFTPCKVPAVQSIKVWQQFLFIDAYSDHWNMRYEKVRFAIYIGH